MANIRQINFDDDNLPSEVTMSLTLREAVYLARLVGGQSHVSAGGFLPGGGVENDAISDVLTQGVFFPYWEDGVHEAIQGL